MLRFVMVGAVVVGLVLGGGVQADPLDQVGQDLSLKAQKLVRDVNFNFSQARALERTNPQRARDILRQSKSWLEDDVSLPERQRQDLLRQVNSRLSDLTTQIAVQKKADEVAAKQAEDRALRQKKNYQESKKTPQTGPASVARDRIGSTQDVIAKVGQLKAQRDRGYLGVFNGIEAAATPFDGVVEYPKYWNQLTEMRKPKLHPKEQAVLKALNSTLSIDFKGEPFNEVINYLQEKTGQAIIIDENSLKDAMVESSDPVTFKVNKVTVRTILRKILADRGLAYIIQEGNIQVVTAQRARETMVVRAYPVSDLVGADPNFYGAFTPFVINQNVQNLINLIQTSIEPGHWAVNSGPGNITFHPGSMSLIVRASAEMHYMFGGTGLLGGR